MRAAGCEIERRNQAMAKIRKKRCKSGRRRGLQDDDLSGHAPVERVLFFLGAHDGIV